MKLASYTRGITRKGASGAKSAKTIQATKEDKGRCANCRCKIKDLYNITYKKYCSTKCFIELDKKKR